MPNQAYYKVASRQDVTRSFVINRKAAEDVFDADLRRRDDEKWIDIDYPGQGIHSTRIVQKQDVRILLRHKGYEAGDIVMFRRTDGGRLDYRVLRGAVALEVRRRMLGRSFLIE